MVEMLLGSGTMLDVGLSMYRPLLGQIVNVGFGPAGILGLLIAGAGAALYFMRSMRPELARDHDIFFAAIGLLCGGILFFQGWRLDPILLFGQMLLSGSAVFFATESIRLRGVATEQARRNTPIVDDERPVGRVYRAELDELYPSDEVPPVRRIRGTREGRSSSRNSYEGSSYEDQWSEETRASRRPRGRRSSGSERRSPVDQERPSRRRRDASSDLDDTSRTADTYSRRSRSSRARGYDRSAENPERPRRRRPRSGSTATPSQDRYVDYRPINYTDDTKGFDSSSGYDDEWS